MYRTVVPRTVAAGSYMSTGIRYAGDRICVKQRSSTTYYGTASLEYLVHSRTMTFRKADRHCDSASSLEKSSRLFPYYFYNCLVQRISIVGHRRLIRKGYNNIVYYYYALALAFFLFLFFKNQNERTLPIMVTDETIICFISIVN